MGWQNVNSGGSGSGVQSVTGLNTDNSDPANPIVKISVDGLSITGDGTPSSPLQVNNQLIYLDNGQFQSNVQQPLGSVLTEQQVDLEITNFTNGVSVDSSGNLLFQETGYYMIDLTLQFTHNAPLSNDYAYVWLKQNVPASSNLPFTTRQIVLNPNIRSGVLSYSYILLVDSIPPPVATNRQFGIWWTGTSTDILLDAISTPTGQPQSDTPSVICNVFKISDYTPA